MVEIGVFHNGSTDLKQKVSDSGSVIPDASVEEIHQDAKQVIGKNQIEHGVLADKYGYDRVFFTEHHFQPTGSEHSPNPMFNQMAVAAQTEDIKLCQATNIITWHDPLRFAEMAATLDVYSDGRAEIGIGRGYQPRENEVLGQYWGGTVQDQEKNRSSFQEKFDIIKKAWTENFFSHTGEFHSIPPSWTKWHHEQDHDYLSDEVSGVDVDEILDWDEEGDFYSNLWNPVVSGGSTLKKVGVFPQPRQEPHPQLWQPLTSSRSIKWAARNGVNGYFIVEPNSRLKQNVELYYEAAEEAGWPDHRPEYDGEPFKYGWDERRNRGVITCRNVFNTEVHDDETFERWKLGLENAWSYYGAFGFAAVLAEGDEDYLDMDTHVTADMLLDKGTAIAGDADHIRNEIAKIKEEVGYEDFNINVWCESAGITGEEANEQLKAFADEVVPYLEEEFPSPTAVASDD